MNTDIRAFALDLAERAGFTFVQAFIASFGVAQASSAAEMKHAALAAAVAGGAAVLALVKGVLAGTRTGTASLSKAAATWSVVAKDNAAGVLRRVQVAAAAAATENAALTAATDALSTPPIEPPDAPPDVPPADPGPPATPAA